MRHGVMMFVTDLTTRAGMGPVELARAVEERGLDSVFLPEHTHIPVSRRTPYPAGGPLPDEYRRTIDPFVGLAAAAAATTRVRLGTGVCLVAQRDPIVTAKAVASLDLIAGGRFVLGVGVGWNQDEAESHGVDFRRRRARAREHLVVMDRLWRDEEASFDGEFVRLAPSWSWPKPAQRPRPPIFVGGAASPRLFDDIAELADGWMPIGGAGVTEELPRLRAAFERAGRDPATARVLLYYVMPDPGKLAHYRALGVEEVVFALPSAGADVVLPILDRYAALASGRGV
jgi:probable F420-dependent oxidoreductase